MNALDLSGDPLRAQAGAVRSELSKLLSRTEILRRRVEQLSAVRDEAGHLAAQIARLEQVLDFDRVAEHVRGAVTRASLAAEPVPHLIASGLLPADVYLAVIDAIPAPVFFDGRAEEGQELRVPPRLAPTAAIVTWMFLNEVGRVLSDLLVARFETPLAAYARTRFPTLPPIAQWGVEIALLEARLVRREPGYTGVPAPDRPWDFLTGVYCLARPGDTEEFGSVLDTTAVPFRANAVLVFLGPASAQVYAPIPRGAPAGIERHIYEFGLGPTRDARRTLTAMLKRAAADPAVAGPDPAR